MKILLVITKAEIGGAQAFVLNLAKGLKRENKDVTVVFGEGNYLPEELAKESIPYIKLKSLKRSANPVAIFSFVGELKKLIKKEEFDVVHFNSTNTLAGVLAVKNKKIKTIFTVHGLSVLDKNYKASKIIKLAFRKYFKYFFKYIDKIVFVSHYNYLEAKNNKLIEEGEVIYNGLDLDDSYFITTEEARKTLEMNIKKEFKDIYLIGSIGRLAKAKNYQFLINNWQGIKRIKPNAKLIIIGEGSERERYEKLIKANSLENDIYLAGEMNEASRFIKAFDLFILPSIYEGLSISLIEAVLAGVPTLASDVGGNSEVIGKDNCFALNNKEDLVNKLEGGINTIKDLDKFSLAKMVSSYIKTYEV